MIEVSPKPLFGKHSYGGEQRLIVGVVKEIDLTVALVSPMTAAIPFPLQKLPAEFRRRKIKEHLTKAKMILNELGV